MQLSIMSTQVPHAARCPLITSSKPTLDLIDGWSIHQSNICNELRTACSVKRVAVMCGTSIGHVERALSRDLIRTGRSFEEDMINLRQHRFVSYREGYIHRRF